MTLTRFLLASALTLLLAAAATAQPHGPRGDRGPQDLDGDGAISRAEFDTFTDEQFNRLDADGDGVISEEEKPQRSGRSGFRGRGEGRGDHAARHQMMAAGLVTRLADLDGDRAISAAEWQDFLAQLPLGADGNIDVEGFAEALPAPPEDGHRRHRARRGGEGAEGRAAEGQATGRPGPPRDRGQMLTRVLDTNGDQVIAIADFEELFAILDADEDGALSDEELPRFRHRGPRGG